MDFNILVEFEESLSIHSTNRANLLLTNLEFKIEYFNTEDNVNDVEFTDQDLQQVFDSYSILDDEFISCSNCGYLLNNQDNYQTCCKNFINQIKLGNMEQIYWKSFINNPTATINTLPHYTELLIIQQGIPPPLRSIIWKKLFLLNNKNIPNSINLIYSNFQHSYNPEISKQISKDLNRTFPTINFFKNQKNIENLSTILNVYANYDVELGYCQGLLFLVGVLYYHFHCDCQLTFHALISIMNLEPQLHNIFTMETMSSTLQLWLNQFIDILKVIDYDLYQHLSKYVEFQTFLYQWWLSFLCSHTPDLSIINRTIDFCLIQGWKVGLFKISIGLLISNKPILMAINDEEVIYQHLLNESKWGKVIINSLDVFFGDLLLSWDEKLFITLLQSSGSNSNNNSIKGNNTPPQLSMFGKMKGAFISSASSTVSNENQSNDSSLSLISNHPHKSELESIYSDVSDVNEAKSFTDYIKLPSPFKSNPQSTIQSDLLLENENLKKLLKSAYFSLLDHDLKQEISKVISI